MSITYLYTVFQLDLENPGIPREDYGRIIDGCYEPLLEICESGIPLGIGMTGLTMAEIAELRPGFMERFAMLVREGRAELVGSGYAWAAFPLIPTDVNRWNIESGVRIYKKLLGMRPTTAVVDEGSFTRSTTDLYREAGYENIVLVRGSVVYSSAPAHRAQRVTGLRGAANLLVADPEASRKFVECARGFTRVEELVRYAEHASGEDSAFSLYAGGAEVFDYSLTRGPKDNGDAERLAAALTELNRSRTLRLMTPAEAIDRLRAPGDTGNVVHLDPKEELSFDTVDTGEVNPLLWQEAISTDPRMSAALHRAYAKVSAVESIGAASPGELKGLREVICRLWGKAYAGYLIDERQREFDDLMGWFTIEIDRLLSTPAGAVASKVAIPGAVVFTEAPPQAPDLPECCADTNISRTCDCGENKCGRADISTEGATVKVSTGEVSIEFLRESGMAIGALVFPGVCEAPVLGTHVAGSSGRSFPMKNYFSGHVVVAEPDSTVTTDLFPVTDFDITEDVDKVTVSAEMRLGLSTVTKTYRIFKNIPKVELSVRIRSRELRASSLRTGNFTLLPEAFDRGSLWLETVNGGLAPERTGLEGLHIPPSGNSMAVPSNGPATWCLGATDGWVRVGDKKVTVEVSTLRGSIHTVPVVCYLEPRTGPDEGAFVMRLSHTTGGVASGSTHTLSGLNEAAFSITAWRNKTV